MPVISPTITAYTVEDYKLQMAKISHFARRIQIDLTDGKFTKEESVKPDQAWWPVGIKADFHLMYEEPLLAVNLVLVHKPNLVIVHAEAKGAFEKVYEACHQKSTKVGVALLAQTEPNALMPVFHRLDHVLIFSGNLGYQGGSQADLKLLEKVKFLKQQKADIEIGWDGGVNDQNVAELISCGVDVLNVGGFIQKAENPAKAYNALQRIADETGTT